MENDGADATSRGSQRSSSTQGMYLPTPGEESDGIAPKCRCGVYAILYLSKTPTNPNRLFFGCPFFRGGLPHCRYFLLLDEHISRVRNGVAGKSVEDVGEHFATMEFQSRISWLEKRVGCLEQRKKFAFWPYVIGLVVIVVAMWAVTMTK
ncbi:hypothetical protein PIB30_033706 [Stylosanthes scabra]|uniref:Zinc finger GRF-type domain-containing protein n=1 Tax=Stylosanthes scabra TaxID=79078 RepID=A0ABU6XBE3_9FABA|nr:hypothetical protein [Stylosanthes scabra]